MSEPSPEATDTDPGAWSYEVFAFHGPQGQVDAWAALDEMVRKEGPTEAYWSARAFALDGRFELQLDERARLLWGGPLLDLASALADWYSGELVEFRFDPVEQAPSLSIRTESDRVSFLIGGAPVGTLPVASARSAVQHFLETFGSDVSSRIPSIMAVSDFWWIREFGRQ